MSIGTPASRFAFAIGGVIAILIAVIAVRAWIADAPERTAVAVLEAVAANRPEDLAPYLDSPRIEASLQTELTTALAARRENQGGWLQALRAGAAGIMLLFAVPTAIADPKGAKEVFDAAKALVNPAEPQVDIPATAHALSEPKGFVTFVAAALDRTGARLPEDRALLRDFAHLRLETPEPDKRVLTLKPDGLDYFVRSRESKLVFERRGWWGWTVTAIDLPDDGTPALPP